MPQNCPVRDARWFLVKKASEAAPHQELALTMRTYLSTCLTGQVRIEIHLGKDFQEQRRSFCSQSEVENLILCHRAGAVLLRVLEGCIRYSFWDVFDDIRNQHFGTENEFAENKSIPIFYSSDTW